MFLKSKDSVDSVQYIWETSDCSLYLDRRLPVGVWWTALAARAQCQGLLDLSGQSEAWWEEQSRSQVGPGVLLCSSYP